MKLFFLKLSIFTILAAATINSVANTCETEELCPVNTLCQCDIMPSSAFDRYFYFTFEKIEKNHLYHCDFTSSPSIFIFQQNASIFPIGSVITCIKCPKFPVKFTLDTTKMQEPIDIAIVQYFVPASDIPSHVTAECRI